MDSRLKQRLIGAAVLVALAVIFLPMLVQGPAPDSGISSVPLSMPDTPDAGTVTRDLPLVSPGEAPDGGAVGMDSRLPPPVAAVNGVNDPANAGTDATAPSATPSSSQPLASSDNPVTTTKPLPAQPAQPTPQPTMFPAPTAGGDYAVSFGAFATQAAADRIVGSLRASQLPGYRDQTTSADGKPTWRVRIGPYASRAEAEAARLRAAHVRDDVAAKVVALDATATATTTSTSTSTSTSTASRPPATTSPPVAATTSATTAPATTPAAPAAPGAATNTGFAIQLAAFSKPADAAALRDRLRSLGFTAFTEAVNTDKGALTRVRVGPVMTRAEATQLQAQVKSRTGLDGIVRPHP